MSPARETTGRAADEHGTVDHVPESRRSRLYRDGRLVRQDVAASEVRALLADPAAVVWVDRDAADAADLALLTDQLDLSRLALDDTLDVGQRPKVNRHGHHLLLTLYGAQVDRTSGELTTSELGVLAGDRWLITVHKTGDLDMAAVERRWDEGADLARHGVAFLLHGLLDHVVDTHSDAAQQLDDVIEEVEAGLFGEHPHTTDVLRRCYAVRKSLVGLRHVALPMREVLLAFTLRDLHTMDDALVAYFADVLEQVLRVGEWTESLRDLVATIQDATLQMQNNRTNEVMRRLSAYAAIFAATTSVTGFYGMNVGFPQFGTAGGAVTASIVLIVTALLLVLVFRRQHWL